MLPIARSVNNREFMYWVYNDRYSEITFLSLLANDKFSIEDNEFIIQTYCEFKGITLDDVVNLIRRPYTKSFQALYNLGIDMKTLKARFGNTFQFIEWYTAEDI